MDLTDIVIIRIKLYHLLLRFGSPFQLYHLSEEKAIVVLYFLDKVFWKKSILRILETYSIVSESHIYLKEVNIRRDKVYLIPKTCA